MDLIVRKYALKRLLHMSKLRTGFDDFVIAKNRTQEYNILFTLSTTITLYLLSNPFIVLTPSLGQTARLRIDDKSRLVCIKQVMLCNPNLTAFNENVVLYKYLYMYLNPPRRTNRTIFRGLE